MEKELTMRELVDILNRASEAYYNTGTEIMSNKEYDDMYDALVKMERESGMTLPDSPTQNVGAVVEGKLPEVKLEFPAKSLDKTKDITEFPKIFFDKEKLHEVEGAVVMWKLDGSTIVLTYNNGSLESAVTRGNGEVGQLITHNAPYIAGIPKQIPFNGKVVVRGEAVMSFKEFERINRELEEGEEEYKNPRNLANATITISDSRKMRKRKIQFFAFKLVYAEGMTHLTRKGFWEQMKWLEDMHFATVDRSLVLSVDDLLEKMNEFSNSASDYEYPVDGLVVASNDVFYAQTQPETGHHPNKLIGYAFKWADEVAKTRLKDIEWSPSRTGLLNPVAVFESVELEGTIVSRASIHNVSILKKLRLRIGDEIGVYKANKIIPQISENFTTGDALTYSESHPETCPCCGGEVEARISNAGPEAVEVAVCVNPECPAKHIKKYVHFAERDCMNIDGLSEKTIEKFVDMGFIKEFADIYKLNRYEEEITGLEGFGTKSYQKLWKAIEESKSVSFVPFIHALGIPAIGKGQAKLLDAKYKGDVAAFFANALLHSTFSDIPGFGDILEKNIWNWADQYLVWINGEKEADTTIQELLKYITFEEKEQNEGTALLGKIFVITGSLMHFSNREELVAVIEKNGGKVSGSVSAKTSYLINNDVTSTSGKNKKAKELNVPIISEDDFLKMLA